MWLSVAALFLLYMMALISEKAEKVSSHKHAYMLCVALLYLLFQFRLAASCTISGSEV